MPNLHSWGGAVNNTQSFTDWSNNFVYQDGIPMPLGNPQPNGSRPIKVHRTDVGWHSGATDSGVDYRGSGNRASAVWGDSGGTFRFALWHGSGRMYFGRNTTQPGTIVDSADGDTYAGAFPGSMQWSTVPTAPVAGTLTQLTTTTARLTWSAPGSDGGEAVNGYRIEYATNSTFTGSVTFEVGNVTTQNLTGLTAGATYYVRVAALNSTAREASTSSAWATTRTLAMATAPGTPSGVTATQAATTSLKVAWTAPGTGGSAITGYTLQIATNAAFTTGLQTFNPTALNHQVNSLTVGATYYARVRATNAFGTGNWSAVATKTLATAPAAATLGALTQTSLVAFTANWTAPASNGGSAITGYRIQVATNAAFTAGLRTVDVGVSTSRSIGDLTPGTTYYVRVAALNAMTAAGVAVSWSTVKSIIMVAAIGNLDGWNAYGALPSGITALVAGGLRRGSMLPVAGQPTALIRELRSAGTGGPTTPNVLGIQRTMTGLKVGATYRFDAKAVGLSDAIAPANVYSLAVVGIGIGGSAALVMPAVAVTIPSYTFVATATSHTLRIHMSDAASWSGTDWFENTGFYQVRLYEIPNISPYRLQDTVYEGPLSTHFTMACDTVGAAWWVDRDNVTQFRQSDSSDSIKATFTDKRAPGAMEYVDIAASYATRDLRNVLKIENHGRNAADGKADDTTTLHQDAASVAEWGARSGTLDMTMRRTGVYDNTNLVRNPKVSTATTDWTTLSWGTGGAGTTARVVSPFLNTWQTHVFRMTWTTAPSSPVVEIENGSTSTNLVTAGKTYTGSGYVRPTWNASFRAYLYWYNAAGAFISASQGTAQAIPANTPNTRLSVTGVAPAGAVRARLGIQSLLGGAAPVVGSFLDASSFMLTEGEELLPYFDGDTLVTQDYTTSWSGAANLSASVRARSLVSIRAAEANEATRTPRRTISSIRWNAAEDPALAASLDIQDRIQVEFKGAVQESRIRGIKHDITPERWMLTLTLTAT